MISIVPYQFEPESDDETVEVADRQETDSQARLEQDVSQWEVSNVNKFVVIIRCDSKLFGT